MEGPQIREISPLRAMFSARLAYPIGTTIILLLLWAEVEVLTPPPKSAPEQYSALAAASAVARSKVQLVRSS